MNWPMYALNFPIGINPPATKFMIPGTNITIDLGQFLGELMKFRTGNIYDNTYLQQVLNSIVSHSMTPYFINTLNSLILAYGLIPSHQLSVVEFIHTYNYLNNNINGEETVPYVSPSESSKTIIETSNDDQAKEQVDAPIKDALPIKNTSSSSDMPRRTFGLKKLDKFVDDLEYTIIPMDKSPSIQSSSLRDIEVQTDSSVDPPLNELRSKLEEAVNLIPKIPSEKLDIALSLVLKKTYIMDKKIRNRMYGELTDVKAQVNELKINRHKVQEREDATKKVRIFLGRK